MKDFVTKKIEKIKKERASKKKIEEELKKTEPDLEALFNNIYDKSYLDQVNKLIDFLNEDIKDKDVPRAQLLRLIKTKGGFSVACGTVASDEYYKYVQIYLATEITIIVKPIDISGTDMPLKDYEIKKEKDKAFEYFLDQISELDKDRRRWYGL